jgi:hypothetical protein
MSDNKMLQFTGPQQEAIWIAEDTCSICNLTGPTLKIGNSREAICKQCLETAFKDQPYATEYDPWDSIDRE